MKRIPRSRIFILEFCLIVVPFSAIASVCVVAIVWPSLSVGWLDTLGSVMMAGIAMTPFICGCYLSIAYLGGGENKLASLRSGWWWGAYAGALIPLVGFVALLLYTLFGNFAILPVASDPESQPFGPPRIGGPMLGIIAAPLLVPLWHLSLMRRRINRSNNNLKSDASEPRALG